MTRYGTSSGSIQNFNVTIEVKSLNHRFTEVRCRFPTSLQDYCFMAEKIARTKLHRGKIEITARVEIEQNKENEIDSSKALALMEQIKQIRDQISPHDPLPFSVLASFPNVFKTADLPSEEIINELIQNTTQEACKAALEMGIAEGKALDADFRFRLKNLSKHVSQLEKLQPDVLKKQIDKTQQRLSTLLEENQIRINAERLEQETVLFADKLDITEELVRLKSHQNQFLKFIDIETGTSTEPIGKKLDFLLQEMNREANTIGSKSTETDAKWICIELKSEIEKMREQVQNVL